MAAYALILAAGFSTRMVSHFKPLLPMPFPSGCRTALSAVCALYRAENVHPLVIGGYRAEKTEEEALACGAGFIRNAHPEAGMFSSIRTGAAALPRDCSHFFVHPVDIPLVRRITIQSLLKAAEQKKTPYISRYSKNRKGILRFFCSTGLFHTACQRYRMPAGHRRSRPLHQGTCCRFFHPERHGYPGRLYASLR